MTYKFDNTNWQEVHNFIFNNDYFRSCQSEFLAITNGTSIYLYVENSDLKKSLSNNGFTLVAVDNPTKWESNTARISSQNIGNLNLSTIFFDPE